MSTSLPTPTQPNKIKLNYEDYLALPDSGKRYEILTSEPAVTLAPTLRR